MYKQLITALCQVRTFAVVGVFWICLCFIRLLPGARHPPDQGGLQHEARRVGRSLQDRPGGQGQEGREVLRRRGEFNKLSSL